MHITDTIYSAYYERKYFLFTHSIEILGFSNSNYMNPRIDRGGAYIDASIKKRLDIAGIAAITYSQRRKFCLLCRDVRKIGLFVE